MTSRTRRSGRPEPGAVVIGGDYQGLGIVRSLGRRGVPVVVVDDERSIARHSRYTSLMLRAANLRDEDTTVEALVSACREHGLEGWVLFPTREETVAALARHREELGRLFRIPTPPWEVTKWAWDKRNTYRRAAELGIPAPRTWYATGLEDVHKIDAAPPFAIKPAIKEHFIYKTKCKAWRADSRSELVARFHDAAAVVGTGEVIVQELIPGSGERQFAYCAFFKNGRAHASMVVRRLRQHPPEFGRASTFVETVDLPELETLSARFLRSIDYYGLVELEYKHDERDGCYKLLDVNARTWGYHSVAQRAGVDFPYVLFADQVGLPAPDAARARPGVFWIRLATDVPTALVELVGGRLDWRGYLRSLSASNVESVFTRDDPRPGMAELALLPYLSVKRGF